MSLLYRLQRFFRRRHSNRFDKRAIGLELVVVRDECSRGTFVFPGRDMFASIELEGQRVGGICYGISPLKDRIYISDFRIDPSHQRCGVGFAALWRLWRLHQMPLTPMHEVGTSIGFWAKARKRFANAGVELTKDVRTGDQSSEQERWQHLVPEPEHERLIRELMESPEWPALKARMDAEHGLRT